MISLPGNLATQPETPPSPIGGAIQFPSFRPGAAPAPNPLIGVFGSAPWETRDPEIAERRRNYLTKLDQAILDPDTFFQKNPINPLFESDAENHKATILVQGYLRYRNGGKPPSGDSFGRDLFRSNIATADFGGKGAESDTAFLTELRTSAQKRKDGISTNNFILTEGARNALLGAVDEPKASVWAVTREALKSQPGYDPTREGDYYQAWSDSRTATLDGIRRFREPLSKVWSAMQSGEDLRSTASNAYFLTPEAERGAFMDALGLLARTLPKDQQPAFWANLKKQSGRDAGGLYNNATDAISEFTINTAVANNPEETAYQAQGQMENAARNFRSDVKRIEAETYDPVKNLMGDGYLGAIESGIYSAPGALLSTAMMAIPGAGTQLMYSSMVGAAYDDTRRSLMEGGMSDEEASARASEWAPAIGAIQFVPEMIGFKLITRKLPMFEKAMASVSNRVSNRAVRGVALGTTIAAGETLTENIQDLVPSMVQEVAGALGQDVPDVDWSKEFEDYDKKTLTTFVATLPLAIFGAAGGLSNEARARAFKEADPNALRAAGVSEEAIANIQSATGQASINAAVDAGWSTRNPNTPEALAAQQAIEDTQIADQATVEEGQALGIIPRFDIQQDGTISVIDTETGNVIGSAPNSAAAMAVAAAHTDLIRLDNREQTAFLGSLLESAALENSAGMETSVDPFRLVTAAQQAAISKQSEDRVMAQAAMRSGAASEIVLGSSRTDFRQGLRVDVNRINSEGSVLTVVHEKAHAVRRRALASNYITREEEITLYRSLDEALAGHTTRGGSPLQFLKEGIADADVSDSMLDEAFSELMEAETLRTRKKGKGSGTLVSKNLTSLARLGGGARKIKDLVDTLLDYFGLAFGRSYQIQKAMREGKLDEAQLEDFKSKLFGLSEQDAFDQAARDAESAILEGLIDPAPIGEGEAFSLGRAGLADELRGEALSRIKNPLRRAQAMARLAEKMGEARLAAERLDLEATSRRAGKSLRKEAAMREAQRAEELEREAYARHWGILSNDDLVKIKSQPGHAFLASPDSPLHGRLMSKSAAIKKHPDMFQVHRPGDYDGSDGVSRSVFGGKLMPDQAAQEMYDAGLIKSPTPDAMWELLIGEVTLVQGMKEQLSKAQEDIRNARKQAKEETNEWLSTATSTNKGEAELSLRADIVSTLTLLDGILSVLPTEIRSKVGGYTQLARIASNEKRLDYLRERLDVMDKQMEKWLRAEYAREFEALLKRAKPAKDEAGQKPRGTIGADVHDLFRAIEAAMGQSLAEVEAEAVKLESLVASGTLTPEQESHLTMQANMIRLTGDWTTADAARREAALLEGTRILERGYMAHRIEVSRKAERRNNQRKELKSATGKSGARMERVKRAQKDASKLGRQIPSMQALTSFEIGLNLAFGENSPTALMLTDWERHASSAKHDAIQSALDSVERLFAGLAGGKYRGEQLRWKMAQPGAITIQTKTGPQSFSELEAIQATLMWRQEDGKRHMTGHLDEAGNPNGEWHYNQADIDAIEAHLSESAKAVRYHISERYAGEHDRLNPVYRMLNGVSLPRNKFYSPLTVKGVIAPSGQGLDPVTGMISSGSSISPGSLRTRSQTAVAEPDFKDALQVYLAHTKQMEHYMAYAPFATEAQALLNSRDVGNSVEAAGGRELLSVLRGWMDLFAKGGTTDAQMHLEFNQSLNRRIGRIAASALVGRVSVLLIQSVQLGAGFAQMPAGAYMTRMAKLFTGQLGWGAAMKSDFIRRRREQAPPLVRQALDGLMASKPNRLKYWMAKLGETISGADALFTAGTYAMIYDYQTSLGKKQGFTGVELETFARENAERSTERVAQPTRAGTRSFFEASLTSPSARLLWSFASEPRQKLALFAYAMAKKPLGEKLRAATVTWIVGGAAASLLRAAMRDVRDDEDDEWFDERNWDPARLAVSSLAGPLQGIPFLGDVLEAAAFRAAGQYIPEGNMLSGIERAIGTAKNLDKWIEGDRKWDDMIGDFETIMGGFAPFSDSAAALTSTAHLVADAAKMIDNAFGD